jgi:hypothetical protein
MYSPYPSGTVLVLALAVLFQLAACNQESTDPTADPLFEASHLELVTSECDTSLRDSGRVLYVIRSHDCPDEPRTSTFVAHIHGTENRLVISLNVGKSVHMEVPTLGMREVRALQVGKWREIPNLASWSPRDGAGLLVKDGLAYMLGGWAYGPLSNEVWVSDNLEDWRFLGFAPWEGRHGAGWVVHHDRLFVVAGDMHQDVWSSADGVEWRRETAQASFAKRYTPNVASHNGSLYLYGGLRWLPDDGCSPGQLDCTVEGLNDVWRSDDDGKTWQQLVANAPWEGRGLIHGSVVHEGEIFVIGGGLKVLPPGASWTETSAEFADAWSSRDGVNWTRRIEILPFKPRTHMSVAETSFGCVVSDGSVGTQANVSNELFIARDCVDFIAVPTPPLPARHASSLAEFNGTLVILGGPPTGNPGTAIWQYVP